MVDRSEIFEDKPMNEFMDYMMQLFRERRELLGCPHDYRFLCQQGTSVCLGCSKGKAKVITFTYATSLGTPVPDCDLAYRMIWEEGVLMDIFQCMFYRACPFTHPSV